MPKIILKICIFLFSINVLLYAVEDIKPLEIKKFIFVKDRADLSIGTSAVITQHFKDQLPIIARASVVEKKNGLAKLEIKSFEMLPQDALPLFDVNVSKNDEVILGFLYDRALLIAPNQESYEAVAQKYKNIYFIHPDVFGAYMIKEFKLSPKKSDFSLFCRNNALGLVGFVLKDEVKFFDCADFNLIFSEPFLASGEPMSPFYSRVKGYQKNFFNFVEQEVKDYYEYYNTLTSSSGK